MRDIFLFSLMYISELAIFRVGVKEWSHMGKWYHARMRTLQSLTDLSAEAERFVASLAPTSGATLVTLSGELGAGKTAFVQEVARTLGIEEAVTSPTFVLEKIYILPRKLGHPMSKFKRLVHIDAYRLESGKELIPLGFDELMEDASNLVLLEWPEKVADLLPEPAVRISMKALPDGTHSISYAP